MYEMYDKNFQVEYTEDDEVIVYLKGKEVAQGIIPDLDTERKLMDAAIELMNGKYPDMKLTSVSDAARFFGLKNWSVHWILINQLILNYHYYMIGKNRYITPEGMEAIEIKQKEKAGN